jgi:hypothetical protein
MNVPIPARVGLLRLCGAACGSRGSCRAVWRGHAPRLRAGARDATRVMSDD